MPGGTVDRRGHLPDLGDARGHEEFAITREIIPSRERPPTEVFMTEPNATEPNQGFQGYERIFRAVKGPDREPTATEFTPILPEVDETYARSRRFSLRRVALLFLIVGVISIVFSFMIFIFS
jgi:hypothetical protein